MATRPLSRLRIFAALLAGAIFVPGAALAQQSGDSSQKSGDSWRIFNLDFPGGTLDTFLTAVRGAHPEANIVAPPEASAFPVPPMKLRNITLHAAMQLLEGSAELPTGQEARLVVKGIPNPGSWDPAIRVQFDVARQSRWGDLKSSVWSLAENLAQGSASEDVLGAVQVALATFPVESTIRFHEPTSLLIVRGTEAQLDLVDKTLAQLRGDVRRQSGEVVAMRNEIAMLESELIEMQARLRVAQKREEIARSQFAARANDAKDQMEAGLVSAVAVETWLGEAELALVEAEADLEITQNQTRMIALQLQNLGDKLGKRADDAN